MGLSYGCVVPHSPNLVPEVGGEKSKYSERTREAMTELGIIICEERQAKNNRLWTLDASAGLSYGGLAGKEFGPGVFGPLPGGLDDRNGLADAVRDAVPSWALGLKPLGRDSWPEDAPSSAFELNPGQYLVLVESPEANPEWRHAYTGLYLKPERWREVCDRLLELGATIREKKAGLHAVGGHSSTVLDPDGYTIELAANEPPEPFHGGGSLEGSEGLRCARVGAASARLPR